jgi:carbonic anhydrase/acetyltransferase-like protein (isoleucine patch superfamily)
MPAVDRAPLHRAWPLQGGGSVYVGFDTVLFNCTVGSGSVIRRNSVVEGRTVPPGF